MQLVSSSQAVQTQYMMNNAFKVDQEIFELGLPILGICYGMQLMAHTNGGKVESAATREYGKAEINSYNR